MSETPFDSVESAHEYLNLLREALIEAKQEIDGDLASGANDQFPRRVDALRLVLYKLDKLEQHLRSSGRLLNDLRSLRRLLLEERAPSAVTKSE